MTKAQLIDAIVTKSGLTRSQVESVLESMQQEIITKMKSGEEVTLTSFGTFSSRVRKARAGVNPQNPSERIQIPEVLVPKFKAGFGLKNALKNK
jgi:DNA-binding protein HU-beta